MKISTSNPTSPIILLLAAWMLCLPAMAQKNKVTIRKSYSKFKSITVGTGTTFYYGDITSTTDAIKTPKPQINIGYRTRFDEHLSLRGEFQFYSMGASDKALGNESRSKRNLNFRARNIELSGILQYDFVRPAAFQSRYSRRPGFNFYAFGGLGLTTNNPKAEYNGSYVALRPLQTEGVSYGAVQPVVPLGIGVRFTVNKDTDILIDYGYRITFTDYLDDISGAYKDQATFAPGSTALALSDRRGELDPRFNDPAFRATQYKFRGNSKTKDAYGILSVKYQYTFSTSQMRRLKRGVKGQFKSRLNRYK
jgi:Outer membrane protein beta-barrel domain